VHSLFVFTADLHLEDGAWSTRPGIYGDSYYSFNQIIDYCIAHRLPLILGGDVLEKKSNSARPIAQLCSGLSRMQAANLDVHYIQGNHEYDRNAPWLSVHNWSKHMHKQTVTINGVRIYGLDWLPRGEIQTAFKEVPPDTDILIVHQVWKDFMGNIGRTECELTDVHHVQTVLAGDFHVTKTVESFNAQGRPIRMLSPGSICMQDCGEDPSKFFFVIGQRTDGIPGFEFAPVPLKTRRFLNYAVREQDLLDSLCTDLLARDISDALSDATFAGYPSEITKPIVRAKFDKQLPDAYIRLVTAIGETAHVFCEALTNKYDADKRNKTRDGAKNDLLSALGDLLGDGADAYKLAAALLAAEDVNKELDVQFSKYMTGEPNDAALETGSEELGTSPLSSV
jgi:predicted phosphodiesterase